MEREIEERGGINFFWTEHLFPPHPPLASSFSSFSSFLTSLFDEHDGNRRYYWRDRNDDEEIEEVIEVEKRSWNPGGVGRDCDFGNRISSISRSISYTSPSRSCPS
jgi:hypothetical protein